jgi:glycosyltransferase involved in cell wall biosynthesis
MIQALPLPSPVLRLAVLCPGFAADRARRQPWHVADGLARGFAALGHEVRLVTDSAAAVAPAPYRVERCPLLRAGRPTAELRAALAQAPPDRVFLVTGAARLARLGPLDLGAPVSLVMASPRLRPGELLRLGPAALWHECRTLALPFLNALLPGAALCAGLRRSGADEVIYLSQTARRRFARLGLPPGRLLRPQIEPVALLPPPPASPFQVGYFGPPLAARGADLALAAFERAQALGLGGRLLLLLRPDSGEASLARFLARVERSPCRDAIDCRIGMLAPDALRQALAACHAFLLPFRAPVSEVPLVVIEAGLSGRPTIVLPAPGVDEIAQALGGIVVRHPADLAAALLRVATEPPAPPRDPAPWTDWPAAVAPLLDPAAAGFARYRLVALSGVDGGGKTFLLRALQARLDEGGVPHRHVWSRFRNYLSKPLLAAARLTGHNRKEEIGGVRAGYHDFVGRPWLAWPFLCLQVADCVIDAWWRYRRGGDRRLILADRCIYDTLVDLAVDTGLDRVLFGRLGHWLVNRLPRPHLAVVVNRPVVAIRADRPDVLLDRNFARRRALYRRLAEEFRLPVLENDGTAGQFLDRLERLATAP